MWIRKRCSSSSERECSKQLRRFEVIKCEFCAEYCSFVLLPALVEPWTTSIRMSPPSSFSKTQTAKAHVDAARASTCDLPLKLPLSILPIHFIHSYHFSVIAALPAALPPSFTVCRRIVRPSLFDSDTLSRSNGFVALVTLGHECTEKYSK
jgi:hypothetical protein